jgi:peptidoglycan/xylan/chitin deacetylase (PgdA/CDA1 family)
MIKANLPVLMFHSVGSDIYKWSRYFLSVHVPNFERFCNFLSENSYHTLTLDEWYDLQNHASEIKEKCAVLTFDDGYLDNYVYVYPILKKYGLKGTVFVNPEFVDLNNAGTRPRYDQKEFDKNKRSNVLGFLNWEEIAELDNSGVLDIQNHSMSHNKYFSNPKIKDFVTPVSVDSYDWLMWIKKPELKPRYMHINTLEHVQEGTPVLENDRSLAIRRYFPDENLSGIIIDKYFFEKKKSSSAENEIKQKVIMEYEKLFSTGNYPGRYETDEEMMNRYRYELEESRKIFRQKLNKQTGYLCWPGGGYNEISLELAKSLGYKASTISSRYKYENASNDGVYKRIKRKGYSDVYTIDGKYYKSLNPNIVINRFHAQNGHFIIKKKLQLYKLFKYLIVKIKK